MEIENKDLIISDKLTEEIIKKSDIIKNKIKNIKDVNSAIEGDIRKVLLIENNIEIQKDSSGGIVYLTEDGFSEDVGNFNKFTRIATLTKDLIEKVLIIDLNDVVIDGNNKKIINSTQTAVYVTEKTMNIKLKKFNIKTKVNGIVILAVSQNISVECNHIEAVSYGVLATQSRNVLVKNNEIINTTIGVGFLEDCTSSSIIDNKILNSSEGILIYERNSFIEIINNYITIKSDFVNEYGIALGYYNSYNKIEKNKIDFSNRTIVVEKDDLSKSWYGIYVGDTGNFENSVLENKIFIINNNINLISDNLMLNIEHIRLNSNNGDIDIKNNELIATRNNIKIEASKVFGVILLNLYTRDNTRVNICGNKFVISKNSFIYSINEGKSYFDIENVRFGVENSCLEFEGNCIEVESNKINYINNQQPNLEVNFNNLTVGLKNNIINICKNIFKIMDNIDDDEISVFLDESNCGVQILSNEFVGPINGGILLNKLNNSNIIQCNKINSIKSFGILLYDSNGLNIINDNTISNSSDFAILVFVKNSNNTISNNYIFYNDFGIVIYEGENYYNTVGYNNFCYNSLDLFVGDTGKNYILENKRNFCITN